MGYHLAFWKASGIPQSPETIYERLSAEEAMDGLEPLAVEKLIGKIMETFPGCQRGAAHMDWEGENGAFQFTWGSHQAILVSYGLPADRLRALTNLAASMGYQVYDPQKGHMLKDVDEPETVSF